MVSGINAQGELHTKWTSHKHPENANFMQVVYWSVWEKDGKTTILYHLGHGSKSNYIYNMTKEEAIAKFTDEPVAELTEEGYQKWLNK